MLALLVGKRDLTGERRERARDQGTPLAGSSTLNRLELSTPESAAPDRYKLCARLRPSSRNGAAGSVEELERIVAQIRARWPKTRIVIRGDSGFCRDAIMSWCEDNGVRLEPDVAAKLKRQRRKRLAKQIGNMQVAVVDTQMLREAITGSSQFEQGKMPTLLRRFFRYAKSHGAFPSHLANPVDDLFVDPVPQKRRRRLTLEQFRALHRVAPPWMQWLMTLGFHLALRRIDLVSLRFSDVCDGRIVSPIRKTDTDARELEATSVDFPVHPDVARVIAEARRSSLRVGRCPFIVHRLPERKTGRAVKALATGRMEHPAQVLPDCATKAFNEVRQTVCATTRVFDGLTGRELPTLHEIRALSSDLYASAGHDVDAVKDLMAHTDPDMTRAYQKGHGRKVLRVNMLLPVSVAGDGPAIREDAESYSAGRTIAA